MGILSSIWKLFKAVVKKLFKFVAAIFKKFWWVILIVAIIYFAPVIAAYLASAGAPEFLVTAFTWIGGATPVVASIVDAAIGGAAALGGAAWAAYASAGLGTQLAIAVGASMLLAPEETMQVIADATEIVVDVAGNVLGGIAKGIGSTTWWIVGGLAAYFLFFRGKDSDDDNNQGAQQHALS